MVPNILHRLLIIRTVGEAPWINSPGTCLPERQAKYLLSCSVGLIFIIGLLRPEVIGVIINRDYQFDDYLWIDRISIKDIKRNTWIEHPWFDVAGAPPQVSVPSLLLYLISQRP